MSEELRDAVHVSHARLHATLGDLDDATARQPSLLPGWSVGHVVTHLARNADSVLRRLRGAEAGELVPQYAGGAAGRAAEIEAGAGRPAADLVADLVAADDAVDELFARVPAAVWARPVPRSGTETTIPAERLVWSRWREVEVHHVDLGLAYRPADWPVEFVAQMLPDLLGGLVDRSDPRALAAWAFGRGPAPELVPWD